MREYCIDCKVKFSEENKSKGTRSRCKTCYSIYMKNYYKNNPDKYKKHKSEYVRNNDTIWTAKVDTYLAERMSSGCLDCGENNPVVLEFDHRDDKKKIYGISSLRKRKVTIEQLVEELNKCDVVCANCHRIRTANQFGSWRLDLPKK